MKRLRSSDDLDSYGDKNVCKDSNLNRSSSSSHRSFYYKSENVRKGLNYSSASSPRYDRDRMVDDEREGSRFVWKRSEHDFDSFDRRKGCDRYKDTGDSRGYGGGDRNLMHRSESFSGYRREVPKGFRSERDRPRREGSVSSWRRFGGGFKDFDESGRRSRGGQDDGGNVRSPKSLRDIKSPSWSRDSGSEQSRMRSPSRGMRDANSKSKSPTWSKDSGSEQSKSEQSKSVEVKKTEELQVESGSSSEMEEGELEPEPVPEAEPESAPPVEPETGEQGFVLNTENKEIQNECRIENTDTVMEGRSESLNEVEVVPNEDDDSEGKEVVEEVNKLVNFLNNPHDKTHGNRDEIENSAHNGSKGEDCSKGDSEGTEEINKVTDLEKPLEPTQDKVIDLEAKMEDVEVLELNKESLIENEVPQVTMSIMTDCVTRNAKEKGKSVSVTPTLAADSADDGLWIDRESRDLTNCLDNAMEGPSTRGFELFSRSPVKRVDKPVLSNFNKKDENLSFEPLDLSLSLPNVLLPIGAHDTTEVPGSPGQARSVQSLTNTFCTDSDGFTASMSFSGSQSFFHNPSCSLTQNSVDYEQSVGSRPIFQGIDQVSPVAWQGQAQNDPKQKEIPLYQRLLMNGNVSFHQSQASQGISDAQVMQAQHSRVLEGSSRIPNGLDRQLSFHKQLSGQSRHHDDVRSPSQSVGSHEIGSSYSFDKKRAKREKSSGSLYRTNSQKEQEQFLMGGSDFVETIIARIVSEPVHAMAKKFHEMSGQPIVCLKEGIREFMLNADKHGQVLAFQKVLQNRSDITLEVLVKSHRAQLEILVALRTGLPDFLQIDSNIPSPDIAEIFLNLRCRNLTCQSLLPVDECDCKVCMQKNGFCSNCMCLLCSKFDMASNTCSWVGCDVCLHWCHTDCGLRKSYIRNGHSTTGEQGTTEMQFHCVACDHPSEMFGFVKEVFQNFAKEWTIETLRKELEYVKRIFSGSKDMRGRRLHEIVGQMLPSLASKSNLPEVYSHIMSFLTDGDTAKLGVCVTPISSGKEHTKESNGVAGPSQEAPWLKSIYSEKAPHLERPANIFSSFGYDRNDKRTMVQELQTGVQKDYCFDELESIVRAKQEESKMFQARADAARSDAEGLKRIALVKNEKIEDEYTSRIAKLRLVETKEMRKHKLEELQALEKAHVEYFDMKMRMEAEIKILLSKMEATKNNLAM
ncbi:Oberon-like protein [Quillaja saponaria]|uniref:Oberon-like protein n=1 Tax=Quillaja saponaria TaxID=32244 RepID=A0AAD7L090_QUISA|nr:Oberon-like protein [Quillaja saponaria]